MPKAAVLVVWVVVVWSLASSAAAERALRVTPVEAGQVRIDGELREWRGVRFETLGDDDDAALEYAVALDGEALYVGAEVSDDKLVRTKRPGTREDAVVLALALPNAAGRFRPVEVWLFAGIEGRQAASGAVAAGGGAPKAHSQIKVVEGPRKDGAGYVVEARIPLAAIPGARELSVARGAIRLQDVDEKGGKVEAVLASAAPDTKAAALPPVLVGANAALDAFLRHKGMTATRARHDLYGDVYGDARVERVLVAGTFAVVVGPDIEGGSGFHFADLPVTMESQVRGAELRDLTGDGKRELLVTLRQQNELGSRDLLQVMDLASGQPRVRFSLELRKQTEAGEVEAELDIGAGRKGAPPELRVSIGRARGLSADNFRDAPERGVEPILLPWGKTAMRVYRWDGTRFALTREQDNDDYVAPAPRKLARAGGGTASSGGVVHQKPPGTDQLVAEFRRSRGIDPALKPRFVTHVNLAEDPRIESMMLFGKDLLVLGKGFRGGSGFFYFGLPVGAPEDIQRVFTADVTGDGRREIFVRWKQQIGDVQREILLGYSFAGEALQQILAVEVRRAQGGSSVGNVVNLMRSGRGYALVIAPGRAEGWSRGSYPFVAESQDGYGALLLPWQDETKKYRFDGEQLVARR